MHTELMNGAKRKGCEFRMDAPKKGRTVAEPNLPFPINDVLGHMFTLGDIISMSLACRTWRVEMSNSPFYRRAGRASRLLMKDHNIARELYNYRRAKYPAAFFGLATAIYESRGLCKNDILIIQRLMNDALKISRVPAHIPALIDCELLLTRVVTYRSLGETTRSRRRLNLFGAIQAIVNHKFASIEQSTHARCLQALLRARSFVGNQHLNSHEVASQFDGIIAKDHSKIASDMARYGKAMLGAYRQIDCPTTDVFDLFKAVELNVQLPIEMRVDSLFWMGRLRKLEFVSAEKMVDSDAFRALQTTASASSVALPSYQAHAPYWQAMLRLEGRVDNNLMTADQAFDAFAQLLKTPGVKPEYLPFARLCMAKLRVNQEIPESRLKDTDVAVLLNHFLQEPYLAATEERLEARFLLAMLHVENRVVETDDLGIFNSLLRINSSDRCNAILRAETYYWMAVLRCENRVQDQQLTYDKAYDYLQRARRSPKVSEKMREGCDLWSEWLLAIQNVSPKTLGII